MSTEQDDANDETRMIDMTALIANKTLSFETMKPLLNKYKKWYTDKKSFVLAYKLKGKTNTRTIARPVSTKNCMARLLYAIFTEARVDATKRYGGEMLAAEFQRFVIIHAALIASLGKMTIDEIGKKFAGTPGYAEDVVSHSTAPYLEADQNNDYKKFEQTVERSRKKTKFATPDDGPVIGLDNNDPRYGGVDSYESIVSDMRVGH